MRPSTTSSPKKSSLRRPTRALAVALVSAGVLGLTPPATSVPGDGTPDVHRAVSTELTVASFNVLGSSHTRHDARYASGTRRVGTVARLVERHDVEVAGFQEMQADQLRAFLDRTRGRYDVYPGFALGEHETENSLAWDRTEWEPLRRRTVDIPYFDGNPRPMPVVELRNLRTGMTAWFVNVHNPATNDAHPGQDGWRRRAIRIEAELTARLSRSGLPVFLAGDMNEREKAFCPITARAPMQAARGGSNRDGHCDAADPRYVDWVFGHRDVQFHGYRELRGPLVRRTSDHPMVLAEARLDPFRYPDAFTPPAPPSSRAAWTAS